MRRYAAIGLALVALLAPRAHAADDMTCTLNATEPYDVHSIALDVELDLPSCGAGRVKAVTLDAAIVRHDLVNDTYTEVAARPVRCNVRRSVCSISAEMSHPPTEWAHYSLTVSFDLQGTKKRMLGGRIALRRCFSAAATVADCALPV